MVLYWAFVFLMIALVAAYFGFGQISGIAAMIAKILFVIFLALFILSLIGLEKLFSSFRKRPI